MSQGTEREFDLRMRQKILVEKHLFCAHFEISWTLTGTHKYIRDVVNITSFGSGHRFPFTVGTPQDTILLIPSPFTCTHGIPSKWAEIADQQLS